MKWRDYILLTRKHFLGPRMALIGRGGLHKNLKKYIVVTPVSMTLYVMHQHNLHLYGSYQSKEDMRPIRHEESTFIRYSQHVSIEAQHQT